jgi:hypothetical protein
MRHGPNCECCGGACAWEEEDDEDGGPCRHPESARIYQYGGVACRLCDTILVEPDGGE